MALNVKQLTVSSGPQANRDLYTVVEIQGAVSFNTPTKTDVRIGDTIAFQELSDYLNQPNVDVLVIVKT